MAPAPLSATYNSEIYRVTAALILLLSVVCAPLSSMAQSKEKEKRGIGITSAPAQIPAPLSPPLRTINPS